MSEQLKLTVDGTTLLGGAIGAVIATLWSTAPVFLSGPGVAAITSNQKLLMFLGSAIMVGSLLYSADYRDGFSIPKTSLYTGVAAFLIVGIAGYGATPIVSALQAQNTPTGQLTGDNLRIATLQVDGMVCQGCKLTVKNYLQSMDGTKRVAIDLPKRQATVVYEAGVLSADDLVNARVFQGAYSASITDDNRYPG